MTKSNSRFIIIVMEYSEYRRILHTEQLEAGVHLYAFKLNCFLANRIRLRLMILQMNGFSNEWQVRRTRESPNKLNKKTQDAINTVRCFYRKFCFFSALLPEPFFMGFYLLWAKKWQHIRGNSVLLCLLLIRSVHSIP